MTSARLNIARRNTALLLAVLYLSDIFWLVISRSGFVNNRAYRVSEFDWTYFGLFVGLSVVFCFVAVFFAFRMRPLPRIKIPHWFILLLIVLVISVNVLSMVVVDPAARYRGGSFTPFSWVVYVFSKALSLSVVMLVIRENETGVKVSLKWILALLLSYAVTIDGMASALTLFMFAFLIFGLGQFSFRKIFVGVAFSIGLFFVGFTSKWEEAPDYVTPGFMIEWVVARFSVQAEQMYTYVSGNSVVGGEVSYLDLIGRSASKRIDLVLGKQVVEEKPRNVSEAMSYDMHGAYLGSGSSPGILANTAMQGFLFFTMVPVFFAFFFIQHFYGVLKRLSIFEIVAYSFCFKGIHANFSAIFSIFNPVIINMLIFLFLCVLATAGDNKARD